MDESWGLKSILDAADDTAVFIVNDRNDCILYCNYYVTLKTGVHADSSFKGMWEDVRPHMKKCGDGRTYRFFAEKTPFGDSKNVTITRIVWVGGIKAYAIMVSNHLENKEEKDREIIFKALGKSYLSIQIMSSEDNMVYTIFRSDKQDIYYYKPHHYDEWRNKMLNDYAHPEDKEFFEKFTDVATIEKEISLSEDGFSMQFRRKYEGDYRWSEMNFSRIKDQSGTVRTICAQRDINSERIKNRDKLENQLIMTSLANAYRSVYLVDLNDGSYSTVKPDELLFGIRGEGLYDELMNIVAELIPDAGQKKDLEGYFSLEALNGAFKDGNENIGKEYNSILTGDEGWMGISAFKPPNVPGLDNKCVLTFMDITEHKRVEREKNEKSIALDVLSSRYIAIFYADCNDYTYHALKLPQQYKYLEGQFKNLKDLFAHYLSAYVLEEYRDMLRTSVTQAIFGEVKLINKVQAKQEYLFKNIDDRWIRMSITLVPQEDAEAEYIIGFEDYNEIMEQHAMSNIYGTMMLADYEHMYEYDPMKDAVFELVYDGERLVREFAGDEGEVTLELYVKKFIHPDDAGLFMLACNKETVDMSIKEGKTVTHLCIRSRSKEGNEYYSYMYGLHYHEDFGKKYVLITERDANKENG